MIEESGLGDAQGWIPTDRNTLEVKGVPHVYALGDATDLPVSKSGSAAHFEAKIVAARLLAAIRGEEPKPDEATYDGEVMCFLETGYNKATQLVFNYEHPPRPPRDACIAQPGQRAPTMGDASIPSPLHTAPAPTRPAMTIH